MFQLLSVLGSCAECDVNNGIGNYYLKKYYTTSICQEGSFYIWRTEGEFRIDMKSYYNEKEALIMDDPESPKISVIKPMEYNSESANVWIYPIPTNLGKFIMNDKKSKMTQINASVIPKDKADILFLRNVPSKFSIETTAPTMITLRGHKNGTNSFDIIYENKKIEPSGTYNVEGEYYIMQLIVYSNTNSNAIVSFVPKLDQKIDEDSSGYFKGPVFRDFNDRWSSSEFKPYFLDTESGRRRIYEDSLGKCDYAIVGDHPVLDLAKYTIPKGKTLCARKGFIIGSKEKYTMQISNAKNNVRDSYAPIINNIYELQKEKYSNPRLYIPKGETIYSISCDESNTKDCKFHILGISVGYSEKNFSFVINPQKNRYIIPWQPSWFQENSIYTQFWSPVDKKLTFDPWIENGIRDYLTLDKYNDTFVGHHALLSLKQMNVSKFTLTISDVKNQQLRMMKF